MNQKKVSRFTFYSLVAIGTGVAIFAMTGKPIPFTEEWEKDRKKSRKGRGKKSPFRTVFPRA